MADEIRDYEPQAPADLPLKWRDMGDGTYALVTATVGLAPAIDAADVAALTLNLDQTTDTLLLAANANRKGLIVVNDSKKSMFLRFGTVAASTTDYSLRLTSQDTWTMPQHYYTGAIHAVWDQDSTGTARVTEIT